MRLASLFSLLIIFLAVSSVPVSADSAASIESPPSIRNDELAPVQESFPDEREDVEPGEIPPTDLDDGSGGDAEDQPEEEALHIADPLYPFNKAMYHVNDKFYFWILKPVAQGYRAIVPEDVRLSVGNLFDHISTPIRFVNNLLQMRIRDAGKELVRFLYNSTAGVCGLVDAAKTDIGLGQQDEDLGQTFGRYGVGHGIYLVLPFLGPSSLRDAAGRAGDRFLNPVHYVDPAEASVGITVYDKVNETSFRIGDYEDLKKSAIDPYVSLRDAYLQYRKKKVEE